MADNDSRSGVRYSTSDIVAYVNRMHASHEAGLKRAFATPDFMPAIQVGQSEARLLQLLLSLVRAEKVVEVGTLAGYSALSMARALPASGHLWTIEYDAAHAEVARGNIDAAGATAQITVEVGAGVDVLPRLVQHGPFDAMFIDADKGNYDRYGAWAIDNLRPGGLVIGDNAYLFGRLLDDTAEAKAMRTFHEMIAAACDSVCIPTPDGMVLGIRR